MSGDPLRVAVFAESYLPYLSGVTVATEALVRGLGRAGHEVLLVAPQPASGREPGTAGAPGPEPRIAWLPSYQAPAPVPPDYRMPWPVPSAALRTAQAFGPQLVHAQSPFVSGVMARRLALRLDAPLVFTHHTRFGDYRHYLGPLARPGAGATEAYLRRWWAACAAVIAPGAALGEEIRARLEAGRHMPPVHVIPTGVDVAAIRSLPRADPRRLAGWPADSVVAISVGRLAAEKNVDLLLDAGAAAAAEHPTLRLLLVGGGPAEPRVRERIAREDLAGRVHATGALPRTEALMLARGSDLFAFASRTETQGLVVAEALACGVPVVALAAPGVEDAVEDGASGLLVHAGSDEEQRARLGAAIGRLVADAELRQRLADGARETAPHLDLALGIGEIEGLYRELLDRRR